MFSHETGSKKIKGADITSKHRKRYYYGTRRRKSFEQRREEEKEGKSGSVEKREEKARVTKERGSGATRKMKWDGHTMEGLVGS